MGSAVSLVVAVLLAVSDGGTSDPDLIARGWHIVGLGRDAGAEATLTLASLSDDPAEPPLVRTWAMAARIQAAPDLASLVALVPRVQQMPALQRPLSKAVEALIARGAADAEGLIAIAADNFAMQQQLAEPILAIGPASLVTAAVRAKNPATRATAATALDTVAQRQGKKANDAIAAELIKALRFDPAAKEVPWAGGPLPLPALRWDRASAKELVRALIAWYLWAELNGQKPEQAKIAQQLNALGLATPLKYKPAFEDQGLTRWLAIWKQVAGAPSLRQLLAEQKVDADPRFQPP